MRNLARSILCGLIMIGVHGMSHAEEISREQIKGLDEQIQDIKSDTLSISAELAQLEEKLIYPSGTQVALFVSATANPKFRIDAVSISIDGQKTAHHIYTHKELEALNSGGVQRIYTGNLRSGEHTLDVTLIGKIAGTTDHTESATYKFTKAEGPRLVEISLAGPGTDNANIQFKDW